MPIVRQKFGKYGLSRSYVRLNKPIAQVNIGVAKVNNVIVHLNIGENELVFAIVKVYIVNVEVNIANVEPYIGIVQVNNGIVLLDFGIIRKKWMCKIPATTYKEEIRDSGLYIRRFLYLRHKQTLP